MPLTTAYCNVLGRIDELAATARALAEASSRIEDKEFMYSAAKGVERLARELLSCDDLELLDPTAQGDADAEVRQ